MHPAIEQAIEFCAARDIKKMSIVVPFELEDSELIALQRHSGVKRLTAIAGPAVAAITNDNWFVPYNPNRPSLYSGATNTPTLFLGGPAIVSIVPLLALLLHGRMSLVCRVEGQFRNCSIAQILSLRAADRTAGWLRQKPQTSWTVRTVSALREFGSLRRIWRSTLARETTETNKPEDGLTETLFAEIAHCAEAESSDRNSAIPGPVVHVNAGMTAGGVERQICLTLAGLKERGFEDLLLLGEYRSAVAEFQPYVDWLNRISVPIRAVPKLPLQSLWDALPPRTATAMSQLPAYLITEILALAAEFRRLRPEVVHAWQDATCIRAGFAALLAGVPQIILSGRNTDPASLPTHQPYMRPAYRVLMQQKQVSVILNSHAGARSYAAWLGLDAGQFSVIHNAIDPEMINAGAGNMREKFGIPATSTVVGGIFRFLPQKRPLLWIETAAVIAKDTPDTHFLIVGDGPLRKQMLGRIAELGLSNRVHLQSNVADIGAFYNALDLFFLASEREGLANVLLEAQWHGVPIICSDAGGNREAVAEGVTAKIVDQSTPEALSTAILSGLADTAWRTRASREAPAFVQEKFSMNKLIDQTLSLYPKNIQL